MDVVIWAALIFAGLVVVSWFTADKPTAESLAAEAERAFAGIDDKLYRELKDLLSRKRKIEAIKRLREETGVGLYVAKQVVEEL